MGVFKNHVYLFHGLKKYPQDKQYESNGFECTNQKDHTTHMFLCQLSYT